MIVRTKSKRKFKKETLVESRNIERSIASLILDETVSDDDVYEALCLYVADNCDCHGNNIPLSDERIAHREMVRELMLEKRPAVHERLRVWVAEMFSYG